MIDRINEHFSFTNPASIHDEEALTALELAGRTAKKVNECINEVNQIDEKVVNEVNNHIENGDFDNQIKNFTESTMQAIADSEEAMAKDIRDAKNELAEDMAINESELEKRLALTEQDVTSRLNNALSGVTVDSEVIDARGGFATLNERLKYAIDSKQVTLYDANLNGQAGVIVCSNSENWVNLPDGKKTGLLLNLHKYKNKSMYQIFFDYTTGLRYFRYCQLLNNNSNEIAQPVNPWKLDTSYHPRVTDAVVDANEAKENGQYFIKSSYNNTNLPEGYNSGFLSVMTDGSTTRIYQTFYAYNDNTVHTRHAKGGDPLTWSEWSKISVFDMQGSLNGCNLDEVTTNGYYFVSSHYNYSNLPSGEDSGMLHVYSHPGREDTRMYQVFYSYSGEIYFRNVYNYEFTAWRRMLTEKDQIIAGESNETFNYSIVRINETSFYIYKKGRRGYIRYTISHHIDEAINLDVWRISNIDLCNENRNVIKAISTRGADIEGVVKVSGDDDHVGGVHGDEKVMASWLFVDGEMFDISEAPTCMCNEVKFIVTSMVYHIDSTIPYFNRQKHVTFNSEGVTINNKWNATGPSFTIEKMRSGMLSIQKDVLNRWYDSNVITYPQTPLEISETTRVLSSDNNMVDIYYMGDITAHHWAGKRHKTTATLLQDYGPRLKSYFDDYVDYTPASNEVLYSENHFDINC